jgi:enoyl-CoA hydratase/carnithine racemase
VTEPGTPRSLRVSRDRRVAVITIDRPPANALDLDLTGELVAALEAAAADAEIAVAAIQGTGRFFVSGADIRLIQHFSRQAHLDYERAIQEAFERVESIPMPVIAVLNGHAVGGGLELALACDVRFAAEGVKVGLPEVTLGLLPGAGGTVRLSRLLGKGRALDLLYSGRVMRAAEALELGVVEYVTAPDQVVSAALDYALALTDGAGQAQAAIKRTVLAGIRSGHLAGLAAEVEATAELLETADYHEGVAAFLDRRSPRFSS